MLGRRFADFETFVFIDPWSTTPRLVLQFIACRGFMFVRAGYRLRPSRRSLFEGTPY